MFLPLGDNIRHRSFPILPCILIGINVLVFAHQIRIVKELSEANKPWKIRPAIKEHYETWGLVPSDLQEGQVIGVLTHMFMHGGVMHLVGNMIVLWAFACSLEAGLGSVTLMGYYILWGIAGGLAHAAMDWSGDLPLVGASGAIAGLIGAYTVLYGFDAKIHGIIWLGFHPIKVQVPAIVFGLGWIGMQLWDASNDPAGISGVAWFAHIGGFIAGAVTVWLFNETERSLDRDTSGNLTFKDSKEEMRKKAERRAAEAVGRSVDRDALEAVANGFCPYCKTELESAVEISPGLQRCANEDCARLVYDELEFVN